MEKEAKKKSIEAVNQRKSKIDESIRNTTTKEICKVSSKKTKSTKL